MQKIKLQKTVGNLLDKFYMNGNGHLEIFSHPQVMRKFQSIFASTDILQKTVVGCPPIFVVLQISLLCSISCTYLTIPYICFYCKKLYFMALDSNFLNMRNESDGVLQVR